MWTRLAIHLFLLGALRLNATTINAASASRADVGAAVALAVDGDTVAVPAGTAHWTSQLVITSAITLRFSGTNTSIIHDDIPSEDILTGSVIRFETTAEAGRFYRLTGVQFPASSTRAAFQEVAQVEVVGTSKAVRIDNCHFGATPFRRRAVTWYNATCGVMDHCRFLNPVRQIDFRHDTWAGGQHGDGSWSDPSSMGTTNTVVIEDSYFECSTSTSAFTDSFQGGRYCVRYCTTKNGHFDSHEGGSRTRGTRQIEIYSVTMTNDDANGMVLEQRGGVSVVFSNTMQGTFANLVVLKNFRSFAIFSPWGGVTGTNVWDNNAPAAAFTGTYTGTNGATTYFVDSGANFGSTDSLRGYALRNNSPYATNSMGQRYGMISANTATTITLTAGLNEQDVVYWTNGNPYSITFVTNALDMPGMGVGDLLSGDPPTPEAWPNQAVEGCYQWTNTSGAFVADPIIREGFHYFNNTPKPGYVPLEYPHPLIAATEGTTQTIINAGTAHVPGIFRIGGL